MTRSLRNSTERSDLTNVVRYRFQSVAMLKEKFGVSSRVRLALRHPQHGLKGFIEACVLSASYASRSEIYYGIQE